MERGTPHLGPRPARRRWRAAVVASVVLAGATFAGVAGVEKDLGPEQFFWAAVASALTGAVTFLGSDRAPSQTHPRASTRPHDVFLSFTAVDRKWAAWVHGALVQAGFRVSLQRWDFWVGQNLAARAEEALGGAELVIVIVSRAFAAASTAGTTWTRAIARQRRGRDRLLLLQVEPVDRARVDRDPDVDVKGSSEAAVLNELLALLAHHGVEPGAPTAHEPRADRPVRFPASGPSISNLPARNSRFTGRSEMLAHLRKALMQVRSDGGVQIEALHGPGGAGKTQIAAEYAHRHADSYDLAWWILAEQDASIANALRGLAAQLGVREDAEQDEMLVALWERLHRFGSWLLVFDNLEDATDLVRYRPSGPGHVLITSRNPAMTSVGGTTLVPMLPPDEASAFLLKRTGSKDAAAAEAIADDLDHLPLALEQAAAYVEETRTSLSRYRELLQQHASDVLAVGQPRDYPHTFPAMLSLSMERAEVEARSAVDLLRLCAFLEPEDIPRDLVRVYKKQSPWIARRLGNPISHDLAVRALSRFSLIVAEPDALSVHRLVQTVVRESLRRKEAREWARVAILVLLDAFPEGRDSGTWGVRARLLPHVVTATQRAQALSVAGDETGLLLQWAAEYEHERGQFLEAEGRYNAALALRRRTHGERHLQVAETLSSLGRLDYHLAHLVAAQQHIHEALRMRLELLPKDAAEIADSLSQLGSVLRELGDLPAARMVTEAALNIRLRGSDPRKVADCRHLLGVILWREGDLTGAQDQHQKAREIRETHFGADSVDVAGSQKHLGLVHGDMGAAGDRKQLEIARTFFERSLTIHERAFGADHPDTADLQSNLGGVLGSLDEVDRARSLLEQAIATRETTVGPDHPDVAGSLVKLASVLRGLGESEAARAAGERALHIFEQTYGSEHHYYRTALAALEP